MNGTTFETLEIGQRLTDTADGETFKVLAVRGEDNWAPAHVVLFWERTGGSHVISAGELCQFEAAVEYGRLASRV